MRKVLFATLLGGCLGIFDGLTAWFTPEVRDQLIGIVIGSTIKGVLTGVIIGFFARAIEKGFFDTYDPSKARFRTFLRVCLDRFMANERKAARRLKRGAHLLVPLDFETAEGELRQRDVAVPNDLDEYFHREWIRSLLAVAVDDLRVEYERGGKATQFQVWKRYDLDAPASQETLGYATVAGEFGVTVMDVTNYLAAARKAFRRLLFDRLRVICGEEEFEAEARHLLRGGFR